jgi:hypothetical protein
MGYMSVAVGRGTDSLITLTKTSKAVLGHRDSILASTRGGTLATTLDSSNLVLHKQAAFRSVTSCLTSSNGSLMHSHNTFLPKETSCGHYKASYILYDGKTMGQVCSW